jgi:hypothetical protein
MAGKNFAYTRGSFKIEIIIRDSNWSKIDTFKFDAKEFWKFASIIKRKYGIDYKAPPRKEDEQKKIDLLGKAEW